MAEYIDITKLKKEISDVKQELWESSCQNRSYITGYVSALSYVEGMIASLPVADVVEIVRCKDCMHYCKHPNSPNGLCYAHTQPYDDEQILRGLQVVRIIMKPDDYCSCGERKECRNDTT